MAHATAPTRDRPKMMKNTASLVDVLVDVAAVLTAGVVQIAGDVVQDAAIVRGDLHLLIARALRKFAMQPCPK